jgi:hypothetical protein
MALIYLPTMDLTNPGGKIIRHNGNQWEIKGRINEIFNQHSYPLVNIQKQWKITIFKFGKSTN